MTTAVASADACPAGCGRPVPDRSKLACPACWRRLPRYLQRAVNAAWANRKSDPRNEGLRRAHEAAKERAIKWWKDNPP